MPENIDFFEALHACVFKLLRKSTDDSWFTLKLNGVTLDLPKYTLLTMHHCLHFDDKQEPYLLVETAHWEKMCSWLQPGDLFLDVGAATGAMCVPYSLIFGNDIKIIAFEPSRRNREYLEKTIARNKNSSSITVLPYAISDTSGVLEFVDMPQDDSGVVPYLSETSHLSVSNAGADATMPDGILTYNVEVKKLDSLIKELDIRSYNNVVVKVDVEGFEVMVLRGAESLISNFWPKFAIDIHLNPEGPVDTDTDQAVRNILEPYGYIFERIGHVLLAEPPKSRLMPQKIEAKVCTDMPTIKKDKFCAKIKSKLFKFIRRFFGTQQILDRLRHIGCKI